MGSLFLYRRFGDSSIYIYDVGNKEVIDKIPEGSKIDLPNHLGGELDFYVTHDSKQFLWRVWGSSKPSYPDDDHLTFIYAYNLEDRTVTRTEFEMTSKSKRGAVILRMINDREFLYIDSSCRDMADLNKCPLGIIAPEGRKLVNVTYTPNTKEIFGKNEEVFLLDLA